MWFFSMFRGLFTEEKKRVEVRTVWDLENEG